MKQTIIQPYDDLYLAEGEKIEATEERTIALNGHEVKLDLTAEHAKELDDLLAPWLAAGQTISKPRPNRSARRGGAYYVGLRAWAEETGYKLSNNGGGKTKYRPQDRDAYDAYLASQGK